ncbi:MAG: hypothetical protein ACR2P2_17330 [Nakamurella sp.]
MGPFKISSTAGPLKWPDVCGFTNEAQLKSLNPQITGLKGKPVGKKSQIIGTGGKSTPFPTDCKFNLTTKFDTEDTSDNPSWVIISLTIADTSGPEIFKESMSQAVKKFPGLPNGTTCFIDSGNLMQCLTGNILYFINGVKNTGGDNFQADQEKWVTEMDLPLAKVLATELKST